MNFDFMVLLKRLAPTTNIRKDVKDDKNVINAKHNETNETVGETEVYTPQSCSNSSKKH